MISVYDDVLVDPAAYRAAALAGRFVDVPVSPYVVFHGIQPTDDPTLPAWIAEHYPQLTPTLSFFRQSPEGQVEPNYVHTDRDMGDWTAILYLTRWPAPGDGTWFWRRRSTGAVASVAEENELEVERRAFRDHTAWEPATQIGARFGRVVLFPAALFHSRAIFENYGVGDEARLIQVVFGTGALDGPRDS